MVTTICLECGAAYERKTFWQKFCSRTCNRAFNRRREKRGAEMYDLVMAWRFDRTDTGPEALKLLCEMAAQFKDDDRRNGRDRSWLTVRELSDQLMPYKNPPRKVA